jgi:type III secretion protein C
MVHADSFAAMNCQWLYSRLLCAGLLLGSCAAWGSVHQAVDESPQQFFTALSVALGVPVVISREVARKRINGAFNFALPQQVLDTLAGQEGLIWHSDGQVLHLYGADEARSSVVALRHISVNRLRGIMRRVGLDEPRYPLRESGARTFYVSGPPSYVDQVLRMAQFMDRPPSKASERAPAFGVVQVFNISVEDYQQGVGANKVRVQGMASMIEARLSSEQKGELADGSLALMAYPDTNSLLIKGHPAQVSLIEKLVAELDEASPGQVEAGGVEVQP